MVLDGSSFCMRSYLCLEQVAWDTINIVCQRVILHHLDSWPFEPQSKLLKGELYRCLYVGVHYRGY